MPQTSQKIRRKIIKLELQNYSICQISKITNIHKATVSRVILRFKECGSLERQKVLAGPRKLPKKWKDNCPGLKKRPLFKCNPVTKNFKLRYCKVNNSENTCQIWPPITTLRQEVKNK